MDSYHHHSDTDIDSRNTEHKTDSNTRQTEVQYKTDVHRYKAQTRESDQSLGIPEISAQADLNDPRCWAKTDAQEDTQYAGLWTSWCLTVLH